MSGKHMVMARNATGTMMLVSDLTGAEAIIVADNIRHLVGDDIEVWTMPEDPDA